MGGRINRKMAPWRSGAALDYLPQLISVTPNLVCYSAEKVIQQGFSYPERPSFLIAPSAHDRLTKLSHITSVVSEYTSRLHLSPAKLGCLALGCSVLLLYVTLHLYR